MRRQFARPAAVGRIQNHGQRTVVRNQPPQGMNGTQVGRGIGRPLAERPANIRAEVEEKRRELQEKYRREAAEAEQKRLRREKKKREDWLRRQESLVRPGHRLGSGRQLSASNMRRDLVEHQSAIDPDLYEDCYHQQETDHQFRMLVQQGVERDRDTEELNRKIEYLGRLAYIERKNEVMKNKIRENRGHPGPANPRRQADFSIDAQEPSTSTSDTRSFGNPRRQPDFVENASLTSDISSSPNPRKPANFLGVAHDASPSISNARGSANPMKPANFMGVAQNASSSTSNANDVYQETSGHTLGSGDRVHVVSPNSTSLGETEVDHRERMRAARLRMQVQYNEEVRRAEQANDQEANNVAEGVERISFN